MRRLGLSLLLTCALLLLPQTVAGQGTRIHTADLDRLYARIDSLRAANEIAAAQVALLLRDTTFYWNFGLEHDGNPVSNSTAFQVGSISKTFAGLTMLLLAERGLVDLESRLVDLAPELPIRNPWRVSQPVRLSHLLEAGAGFVGFPPAHHMSVENAPPDVVSLIEELPYRLDVQWRPGEYTAYHNMGPVLAAYLIQSIAGSPYEEIVRENLLEPLNMEHSSFFLTPTILRLLADTAAVEVLGPFWPSGGLMTTASDLSKLVRMLMDRGSYNGRRVLSRATVERFETPTSTLAARQLGTRYGHAINNWTTTFRGARYHGHGGRTEGYTAYYAYSPEHQTAFVFMSLRGESGQELHSPVLDAVLSFFHPEPLPAPVAAQAQGHEEILGCYILANPRRLDQPLFRVRVQEDEGALVLFSDDQQWTLEAISTAGHFRVRGEQPLRRGRTEDSLVAFVTNFEGSIVMQHLDHPHEALVQIPCR